MSNNRFMQYISAILATVLLFTSFPFITASAKDSDGKKIMVSMGDSYSSGEGVPDFYGYKLSNKEKSENQDYLAHRSENSWPGKLVLNDFNKTMKYYKGSNWRFVASSGAKTKHFYEKQIDESEGKYNFNRGGIKSNNPIDPQLNIFDKLKSEGLQADYVTMTIGGNDVGFANIISEAVTEPNMFLLPVLLTNKLNDAWAKFDGKGKYSGKKSVEKKLREAYESVRDKAGKNTHIIVAGYPKLLSQSTIVTTEILRNAGAMIPYQILFSSSEVYKINKSVSRFNKRISEIINNDLKSDKRIYFVSVEEEFSGHEAYSINSYINPVMFNREQDLKDININDIKGTLFSAYSMHPNDKGTQAYAKCVQKVIDKIEEKEEQNNISEFEKKLMSDSWDVLDYTAFEGVFDLSFKEGKNAFMTFDEAPESPRKYKYSLQNGTVVFNSIRISDINSSDLIRFEYIDTGFVTLAVRKSKAMYSEISSLENSLKQTHWQSQNLYNIDIKSIRFDIGGENRFCVLSEGENSNWEYVGGSVSDNVLMYRMQAEGNNHMPKAIIIEGTNDSSVLNAYIYWLAPQSGESIEVYEQWHEK